LAAENLRHHQSQRDQNNILCIVRVPLLHLAGFVEVDDEGNKHTDMVGRNTLLESGELGKAQYVEHSGAGVGAGFQDLALRRSPSWSRHRTGHRPRSANLLKQSKRQRNH
jgi:hypothetical protein